MNIKLELNSYQAEILHEALDEFICQVKNRLAGEDEEGHCKAMQTDIDEAHKLQKLLLPS